MIITIDKFEDEGIIKLLEEHLADMHANSPPESVHALDVEVLKSPLITFWSARENTEVLGCIALKELTPGEGEIKSMRTSRLNRNQGVASALLRNLLIEAESRGYKKLNLETGSREFFKPAHALYEKFGFRHCGPFGSYRADSNSLFMELDLNEKA